MMLLEHLRCSVRAVVLYTGAALAGVAMAADGVAAPGGMPDLGPVAGPIAMILAAWLVRSGGVITIKVIHEDGDAPTKRRPRAPAAD